MKDEFVKNCCISVNSRHETGIFYMRQEIHSQQQSYFLFGIG